MNKVWTDKTRPGIKKGYQYKRIRCSICGESVAKHRISEHKKRWHLATFRRAK